MRRNTDSVTGEQLHGVHPVAQPSFNAVVRRTVLPKLDLGHCFDEILVQSHRLEIHRPREHREFDDKTPLPAFDVLREAEQHVQRQPPYDGGNVECLSVSSVLTPSNADCWADRPSDY